jgi:hypothetical protein
MTIAIAIVRVRFGKHNPEFELYALENWKLSNAEKHTAALRVSTRVIARDVHYTIAANYVHKQSTNYD